MSDTISFQSKGTKFHVRVAAPADGRIEQVVICATDPPNVVQHYDQCIAEIQEESPATCVIVFELPGFGLSSTTRNDLSEMCGDIAELVDYVKGQWAREATTTLVLPCVAGLMAVRILEETSVDALVVTQCGDYHCQQAWANTINSNGLLSIPGISRLYNYIMRYPISKGWYQATFPKRGSYSQCTGVPLDKQHDITTAATTARSYFTSIAHSAMDQGATFPLAWCLQRMFYGSKPFGDIGKFGISLRNNTYDASINVPTLVIWGAQDGTHRASVASEERTSSFTRYSRSATVEIFEGAAHFPELQQPRDFAQSLCKFLSTVKQPSSSL